MVEEIKRKLDIYSVVSQSISLKERGGRFWGLCPFHQEKTPSFTVSPERGIFYCFGCGKKGDIFTFVQEFQNLSFRESLELLAKQAGVTLEDSRKGGGEKDAQERDALGELYDKLERLFCHLLEKEPKAEHAREYLKSRTLSPEILKLYRIGYAPRSTQWLYKFLISRHYSDDFLKKSGLFSSRRYPYPLFSDRIIFPVINTSEHSIAFSGRALGEEQQPKYINSPQTALFQKKNSLFGISQALKMMREEREVYLCEGNFDVLALAQAGVLNTVAPLGTAFTIEQAQFLKRYVKKINILFDGDEAGEKASIKASLLLENLDLIPYTIHLEIGSDPSSILTSEGEAGLRERLKEKTFSFDFVIRHYRERVDAETLLGKQEIFKNVMEYIGGLNSSTKRELYTKELSKVLEISIPVEPKRISSYPKREERKSRVEISSELHLLLSILLKPSLFSILKERRLLMAELSDASAIELFSLLENREEGELSEHLAQKIESEELKRIVYEKMATGEFDAVGSDFVKESVIKIRRDHLNREKENLANMIQRAEEKGDNEIVRQYLANQVEIEHRLRVIE